ncbi:MAG: DUF4139 domain-containing protein [Sedimentisphaerales bacterium]|nr:DUF4139 domain-containing protein [Sedimentisphaerales bacterium]
MKKHRITAVVALFCLTLSQSAFGADERTTTGTITRVVVYRGQALVTRQIDAALPADSTELIVTDLPANIIPESMYAQASDGTAVLSVRYREQAVKEDTRDEVRKLDQEMEDVQNQIKYAQSELEQNGKQWQMFEKLQEFSVAAANSDLNRGLLAFEPLQNLTALIEQKGSEYLANRLTLEDTIAERKKEQEVLTRKRNELTAGRSRTERQAVLFLNPGQRRHVALELNYLVNGANWQQQYNLRARPDTSAVTIEYNAVVNQTSGEDWSGVTLSLSTAEPTMVAAPPTLEPMFVGLRPPAQVQSVQPPSAVFDNFARFQQSRKDYAMKGLTANTRLNELSVENQAFFFNAGQREVEQFQQQMAEVMRTEGISVTYDLPGRLTLPSRSDQQLVTIATIAAKADFRLVATPLLTDYVYLQADVSNHSETILLPGSAAMFRNGEFVGRSQLPQVTIGERFTAGFGIDSQVRLQRELEEKKSRIQGGNRIDTYRYRVTLSNYKDAPVTLRLLDRLPHAGDPSIKIELEETEPALSADAEYLRTTRKQGILRWDLDLEPHTLDRKATVVAYSFTMEYDRNMQIQARRSAQ